LFDAIRFSRDPSCNAEFPPRYYVSGACHSEKARIVDAGYAAGRVGTSWLDVAERDGLVYTVSVGYERRGTVWLSATRGEDRDATIQFFDKKLIIPAIPVSKAAASGKFCFFTSIVAFYN
jgi:hypothetical protein